MTNFDSDWNGNVKEDGLFGGVIAAVWNLSSTVVNTQIEGRDDLLASINQLGTDIDTYLNNSASIIQKHIDRQDDPHDVTKKQISLWHVDNFATATYEEKQAGTRDDLFITPKGLPALLDDLLEQRSDYLHQGRVPVSRFGSLNYLPPGVIGSYEGSSMLLGTDRFYQLLEIDGTLVWLRQGTNGTSTGVYYAYLTNAIKTAEKKPPVRTNYRYQPPGLPSSSRPISVICASEDCVVGRLSGDTEGYDAFVTPTYGTLDQTQHKAVRFKTPSGFVWDGNPYALMSNGYVYIISNKYGGPLYPTTTTGKVIEPHYYQVMRILIADIESKTTVTPELLTGWTTTGLWRTEKADHIQICRASVSNDSADEPYIKYSGAMANINPIHSWQTITAETNPDNINEIRILKTHSSWIAAKSGNSTAIGRDITALNIIINPNARTARVEDNAKAMDVSEVNGNIVINKWTTRVPGVNVAGLAISDNRHPSVYLVKGYAFVRDNGNQAEESSEYRRLKINNWTNLFDALIAKNRDITVDITARDTIKLGSAIGASLMKPTMYPNGYMTVTTSSETDNGYYLKYGNFSRNKLEDDSTFSYNVQNVGVLKGFAPSLDRKAIDRATGTQNALIASIYITDANGGTQNWPSVLTYPKQGKAYASCNENFALGSEITWDDSDMVSVINAAIKAITPNKTITFTRMSIYVPQDNNIPLIGYVGYGYLDNSEYGNVSAAIELNYSGSRLGHISGHTFKNVIKSSISGYTAGANGQPAQSAHEPGMVIWKTANNDYLIGMGSQFGEGRYGGAAYKVYHMAVKAGTKTVDITSAKDTWTSYYPNSSNPQCIAVPKQGYGYLSAADVQNNNSCNMIACIVGTTLDDFIKWQVKNKIVIVSQQVQQGWVVYFTEPQPVMLSGNEYDIPAQLIDLRTITSDPKNKVFYLYVEVDSTLELGCKYTATLAPVGETFGRMYIGKVVTNDTQISYIEADKVSRLDTYRPSLHVIGSAISVSSGLPNTKVSFDQWTWPEEYL